MHYFVGCSGFSNKDWKGYFYPEELSSENYLKFYAEHFNSVEINTTFYRRPTIKTLDNWYNQSPEGFLFFIKIPQSITHINLLKNTRQEITDFCKHIQHGLKEKLAGFLFQFPPSFSCNNDNLKNILDDLNPKVTNVVEFRDKSWWNDTVYEVLKEQQIIFSGVSIPKNIPDTLIINNPDTVYYRLHGRPILFKSEYSEEEIHSLADAIKASKKNAYIFFNNTWGISAIKNALYLKKLLLGN